MFTFVSICCGFYWINVRQGKILCWKAFSNADSSVSEAFRKLGHVPLEDGNENALEQYICLLVRQEQPLEILLGKDSGCFVGN